MKIEEAHRRHEKPEAEIRRGRESHRKPNQADHQPPTPGHQPLCSFRGRAYDLCRFLGANRDVADAKCTSASNLLESNYLQSLQRAFVEILRLDITHNPTKKIVTSFSGGFQVSLAFQYFNKLIPFISFNCSMTSLRDMASYCFNIVKAGMVVQRHDVRHAVH